VAHALGALLLLLCLASVADGQQATPAAGQVADAGDASGQPRPRFGLAVRGVQFTLGGRGELFAALSNALTLTAADLSTRSAGLDVSWLATPRLEIVGSVDHGAAQASSQSRLPRPGGGTPVLQTTTLAVDPLGTLALRYYLRPPFRHRDALGWGPGAVPVFVGAGAGVLRYTLTQRGEFLDAVAGRTFRADFASRGTGRTAFLSAGLEVPVVARMAVLLESRYEWGRAPLAAGFTTFERIDLSGLRLSLGLARRF
jgi:hypothetical protein